MNHPKLLTPIVLAGQEIKNRIFMAPMGVGFEDYYYGGRVSTEMVDYYEARAKGGTGLIISPFTAVDERYFAFTMGIYSRKVLIGISRLVEALHVYNCKFLLQLSHFGGKSPKFYTYGRDPVAPSSIDSPMYEDKPSELTIDQIQETIDLFIRSGQWSKEMGCDGVELHGAHGYLINQFYSPHTNKRKDAYGGTLEKRLLFLKDIAEGIRKSCGKDFIIGLKFSAHEHLPGGIDNEEAKRICNYLNKLNLLDYIHVSGNSITIPGFMDCNYPEVPSIYNGQPLVPLAGMIKKVMDIPVVAASGISDPDYAEELINSGKADIVAIGRALIAEPEFANKVQNNEYIKPCIKCNICYERVMFQRTLKCSVNPYVGEEKRYESFKSQKAPVSKKIVIIGGGPAGLETAITASNRGHKVVIIEKEARIGGNLRIAAIQDFKKEIKDLLDFYENVITEKNIKVRSKIDFCCDEILKEKPDIVVIAIGSTPIDPNFINMKNPSIFYSEEILRLRDINKIGNNIAIIGAGSVGCETALYLALKNKKVYLIDYLDFDNILSDETVVNKLMLFARLKKSKVEIILNAKVKSIEKGKVSIIYKSGEKKDISVDNVVISIGYTPKNELAINYKTQLLKENPDLDIKIIGDCKKVGKIYDAVNESAHHAWQF